MKLFLKFLLIVGVCFTSYSSINSNDKIEPKSLSQDLIEITSFNNYKFVEKDLDVSNSNFQNDIYRYISYEDAQRIKAGKSIISKGSGGSILDHVRGAETKYISASQGAPDPTYNSGNGLIKILNVSSLRFVPHNNVLQGVKGDAKATQNAKRANEVLFVYEIPFENIEIVDLP